jgi:PAS domain S-box-containing protein
MEVMRMKATDPKRSWDDLGHQLDSARRMAEWLVRAGRSGPVDGVLGAQFIECFHMLLKAFRGLLAARPDEEPEPARLLAEVAAVCDMLRDSAVWPAQSDSPNEEIRWLRAANRSLSLERKKYQNIFDATTNLVLVADHEGRVTRMNPAAQQFFAGRTCAGEPFWRVLSLAGEDAPSVEAAYAPGVHHEIRLSGSEQCFNLRLVPLDPSLSGVRGYILILNDITCLVDNRQALERLVSERTHALANSEKMLRLIFQSAGNGILLLSDDYRIVKANRRAAKIAGRTVKNLVGTDLRNLTDTEGGLLLMTCISSLAEEQSMSAEIRVNQAEGVMLPVSIMVTRTKIDGCWYWPVIVSDISRQKALEERLRKEKQQVEDMNVTLRNVMKSVDGDRREFENTIARRIRAHLLPALDRLGRESSEAVRASYLELIREQLVGLTSGLEGEIDFNLLKLSKTEGRVCQFIQAGCTTKEICEAMNLAFETVQTHRKNIRRKLGLRGKNINLHSYLTSRRSLSADDVND